MWVSLLYRSQKHWWHPVKEWNWFILWWDKTTWVSLFHLIYNVLTHLLYVCVSHCTDFWNYYLFRSSLSFLIKDSRTLIIRFLFMACLIQTFLWILNQILSIAYLVILIFFFTKNSWVEIKYKEDVINIMAHNIVVDFENNEAISVRHLFILNPVCCGRFLDIRGCWNIYVWLLKKYQI